MHHKDIKTEIRKQLKKIIRIGSGSGRKKRKK